jgi:Cu2+-exporting ATPase
VLTIIALSVGAVTLLAWIYLGQSLAFAVERMATVMVITCPHALGLAVPLVIAVSTALAARSGLLIRDRTAFERARSIRAVVFDKTGTLTEGRFGVTDVMPLSSATENDLLATAAALEASSEHPIAAGIVEMTREKGMTPAEVTGFRAIPGRGVEGTVRGEKYMVVSPGYLKEKGIAVTDPRVERALQQGKTVVFLLRGDRPAGAIALADQFIKFIPSKAPGFTFYSTSWCYYVTGLTSVYSSKVAGSLFIHPSARHFT